ncbi:MAG: glycosyltransferase [Actinomycetia bacterium]|nr:glycosyltransferase [Actinomycetes bacterium]
MKIALVAQHAVPLSRSARPAPGTTAACPDVPAGQAEDDIRVRNLSRGLAADGHHVTVYAQKPDGDAPHEAELCPGVMVSYLGPAVDRDERNLLQRVPGFAAPLRDELGDNPPDVVHAVRWTSGLAALSAARDLRIPVVQSFSSLYITERRHRPGPPETGPKRLRLEPAIGRSASAVVTDCEDEESELARAGVPRRAIRVVPCGVDTARFAPEGPVTDRRGRPRLLTVTDSADELATALRVLAQVPDAELIAAGGARSASAARLAGELGVADRVEFAGPLTRQSLPPMLRSADLLLSLSEHDPAGMMVLEAMACGTPVAAASGGGHGDAVVDGTTGILIPARRPAVIAQRVRGLLSHPMRLAAFGVAASDRARSRYSWDRIARETADVYDRAAAVTA